MTLRVHVLHVPGVDSHRDEMVKKLQSEVEVCLRMASVDTATEFVCPKCFHSFVKDVTREAIMKGLIE